MLRDVTDDDQQSRRRRWAILTELACLMLFLVSASGVILVIIIGWPWPLLAVLGVFLARGSVEGILRPDSDRLDEPN